MNTIHQQIKKAGIEAVTYYSDLYVPVTPETTALIQGYEYKGNVKTFKNQQTQTAWYDIPFANDDYYKRLRQVKNEEIRKRRAQNG